MTKKWTSAEVNAVLKTQVDRGDTNATTLLKLRTGDARTIRQHAEAVGTRVDGVAVPWNRAYQIPNLIAEAYPIRRAKRATRPPSAAGNRPRKLY